MLIYGIVGALIFGYFLSFVKIGLASLAMTNCRLNNCLRRVLVDSLTLKISQDLNSFRVGLDKEKRKEK